MKLEYKIYLKYLLAISYKYKLYNIEVFENSFMIRFCTNEEIQKVFLYTYDNSTINKCFYLFYKWVSNKELIKQLKQLVKNY
jgi:hypothetical protein